MRRRLLGGLLALVLLPLSPGSALAMGTLDQEADPGGATFGGGIPGNSIWQTFTAGLTGGLDTISIWNAIPGGTFDVTIREVDIGGAPTAVVLGSGTAPASGPGWIDIAISPVPAVTSGTMYAIVMATSIPFVRGTAAPYAGGAAGFNLGGLPAEDIAFRTFVTIPQPQEEITHLVVTSRVAATAAGAPTESITVPVGSTFYRSLTIANGGTTNLGSLTLTDTAGALPASCPALPASLGIGQSYTCTFTQVAVAGTVSYTSTATAGGEKAVGFVSVTGTTAAPQTVGSKLGLPSTGGAYTGSTKVASINRYVTWQVDFGAVGAGKTVGVHVATKSLDGSWGPFVRLTSRLADAAGVAHFSWRSSEATWTSVRFSLDGVTTRATQARWR